MRRANTTASVRATIASVLQGLDGCEAWRNLPVMQANPNQLLVGAGADDPAVREAAPECRVGTEAEMDISLLEDSLAKTPWERMQANDDALRFIDSLRDAMERRNAKP